MVRGSGADAVVSGPSSARSSAAPLRSTPRTRNLHATASQWAADATPRGQAAKEYLVREVVPTLLPGLVQLVKVTERQVLELDEELLPQDKSEKLQSYIQECVVPVMTALLMRICKERPPDPIDTLAREMICASANQELGSGLSPQRSAERKFDEEVNPLQWLASFLYRHNPRHGRQCHHTPRVYQQPSHPQPESESTYDPRAPTPRRIASPRTYPPAQETKVKTVRVLMPSSNHACTESVLQDESDGDVGKYESLLRQKEEKEEEKEASHPNQEAKAEDKDPSEAKAADDVVAVPVPSDEAKDVADETKDDNPPEAAESKIHESSNGAAMAVGKDPAGAKAHAEGEDSWRCTEPWPRRGRRSAWGDASQAGRSAARSDAVERVEEYHQMLGQVEKKVEVLLEQREVCFRVTRNPDTNLFLFGAVDRHSGAYFERVLNESEMYKHAPAGDRWKVSLTSVAEDLLNRSILTVQSSMSSGGAASRGTALTGAEGGNGAKRQGSRSRSRKKAAVRVAFRNAPGVSTTSFVFVKGTRRVCGSLLVMEVLAEVQPEVIAFVGREPKIKGAQQPKPTDPTDATVPYGEVSAVLRVRLYDPSSCTYLEAASPILLAKNLEARRHQVNTALDRLVVLTLPSGDRAAVLSFTNHEKPPIVSVGGQQAQACVGYTSSDAGPSSQGEATLVVVVTPLSDWAAHNPNERGSSSGGDQQTAAAAAAAAAAAVEGKHESPQEEAEAKGSDSSVPSADSPPVAEVKDPTEPQTPEQAASGSNPDKAEAGEVEPSGGAKGSEEEGVGGMAEKKEEEEEEAAAVAVPCPLNAQMLFMGLQKRLPPIGSKHVGVPALLAEEVADGLGSALDRLMRDIEITILSRDDNDKVCRWSLSHQDGLTKIQPDQLSRRVTELRRARAMDQALNSVLEQEADPTSLASDAKALQQHFPSGEVRARDELWQLRRRQAFARRRELRALPRVSRSESERMAEALGGSAVGGAVAAAVDTAAQRFTRGGGDGRGGGGRTDVAGADGAETYNSDFTFVLDDPESGSEGEGQGSGSSHGPKQQQQQEEEEETEFGADAGSAVALDSDEEETDFPGAGGVFGAGLGGGSVDGHGHGTASRRRAKAQEITGQWKVDDGLQVLRRGVVLAGRHFIVAVILLRHAVNGAVRVLAYDPSASIYYPTDLHHFDTSRMVDGPAVHYRNRAAGGGAAAAVAMAAASTSAHGHSSDLMLTAEGKRMAEALIQRVKLVTNPKTNNIEAFVWERDNVATKIRKVFLLLGKDPKGRAPRSKIVEVLREARQQIDRFFADLPEHDALSARSLRFLDAFAAVAERHHAQWITFEQLLGMLDSAVSLSSDEKFDEREEVEAEA